MPIPLGILAVAGAGGGAAGDYQLIQSAFITTGSVTITEFNQIPQTFKHLQVRVTYQVNTSSTNEYGLNIAFNADGSTTDNALHLLSGNGSSVYSRAASNITAIGSPLVPYPQSPLFGGTINPSSSQSQFVGAVIDILDYSSTNKNKTVRSFSGHTIGGTANVTLASLLWTNTAAITDIALFASNAPNFTIGSRFSLYGIK